MPTPEEITQYAIRQVRWFSNLIRAFEEGRNKYVKKNECEAYRKLWQSVVDKGGRNLSEAELRELKDAIYSGDLESGEDSN